MNALTSPILLRGDDVTAYRDPAAVLLNGVCYLYFTYVDNRPGGPWLYLAERRTRDFVHWSDLRLLTPKNKALNYSSPGSIVRDGADWVICFQTYCRENGEKYGNANSRLYTMRSRDLERWSEPELLRVKGDSVPSMVVLLQAERRQLRHLARSPALDVRRPHRRGRKFLRGSLRKRLAHVQQSGKRPSRDGFGRSRPLARRHAGSHPRSARMAVGGGQTHGGLRDGEHPVPRPPALSPVLPRLPRPRKP